MTFKSVLAFNMTSGGISLGFIGLDKFKVAVIQAFEDIINGQLYIFESSR